VSDVLPLNRAARKLGVPANWLKAEADAGRVPHLRAGAKYVFELSAAAEAIAQQIRANAPSGNGGAHA
jgi:hypothetical protein